MGTRLTVDGSTLALWQANATGDLIDATGNYTLTKFGAISSVAGLVDKAVVIDDRTKYYTHAGDATLRAIPLNSFTIEALIYCVPNGGMDPLGGVSSLFALEGAGDTWGMVLRAFGNRSLILGGGPCTGGGGYTQYTAADPGYPPNESFWLPNGRWVYVALVVKANYPSAGSAKMLFYIDGRAVNVEQASPIGLSAFAGAQLIIGTYYASGLPLAFDTSGWVEEIRLSTVARTAAEIRANWLAYNATAGGAGPSLPDTTKPAIYSIQSVNLTTIQVVFTEDVVFAEAMNPSNYVLTGGLATQSVINVAGSQRVFRLTTSTQTAAASYTLTVSNVHDLAGNLI